MISGLGPFLSYNQDNCTSFIVHEVVWEVGESHEGECIYLAICSTLDDHMGLVGHSQPTPAWSFA